MTMHVQSTVMLGSTATDVVHGRLSTEDMKREKRGKRRQNPKIRALLADPVDKFINSVVSLYTVEVVECCWSPRYTTDDLWSCTREAVQHSRKGICHCGKKC
jgi:hypothetical protein